ncbi:MAG TPA: hypothetical protein DIW54_10780 [Chitinophagaceae bacterium]|nr:hypothetical protein [Chitinophagaceae bacterium]HCT23773.1 hypothetical protein [Chitinophagaceae bacterium]
MFFMYIVKFVQAYRKNDQADLCFALIFIGIVILGLLFRYQELLPVVKQFSLQEIQSVNCLYNSFTREPVLVFLLRNSRVRKINLLVERQEDIDLINMLTAKGVAVIGKR